MSGPRTPTSVDRRTRTRRRGPCPVIFGRGIAAATIEAAGRYPGATVHTVKRADLRWLAVLPTIVAVPFLFFGLLWQGLVQLAVGVGLLVAAYGIWMLFAED